MKPEFYSQFMNGDLLPGSNKTIKFKESQNYWIFKTGPKAIKVKKREDAANAVSLEEIFCREMTRRLRLYSPDLGAETAIITHDGNSFHLDCNGASGSLPLYHAIIMNQLADRYFLDNILGKGKLTETMMKRIGEYLFQLHTRMEVSPSKTDGTCDSLLQRLNDLIYQSKKHLKTTITQPMIDMTLHPLEKYITDNRKLMLRRVRKGLIKEVHGCFIPRKIHIDNEKVVALAKTNDPMRDRYRDIVSDLADLTVALTCSGEERMADCFINAYCSLAGDADTVAVLPIYQGLKCLSLGLQYSVIHKKSSNHAAEETKQQAIAYYEQAMTIAHQL